MLAFVGLGLAYAAIMHIVVLVAAFRESVGTGFLTLCIPIYGLWFVFKTNDSDTLKILYGVAIVVNLVMRLIALKYE